MSVVCDTGSGSIKLGWSYSTTPDYTIPTLLGQPNRRYKYSDFPQEYINVKTIQKDYFDQDIKPMLWNLELIRPIEHGIIKDWDAMSKIWSYGFINKVKII